MMIEYIYFVKCPNCEDEHFDFFEDAKACALGCLSNKPIITQTEVCRNDFGECIDHEDLGTIWSWEDEMLDIETPEVTSFTKQDLVAYDPDTDPEFMDFNLDSVPDNFRKPIPEGMTIEQLVEAMEENEDTVECTWCEELFPKEDCRHDEKHGWICDECDDALVECTWCEELYDKSECRKEVDLGWLCSRCEAAIKSRGETLTFTESDYWDFLDEDATPKAQEASDSEVAETESLTESAQWTCFFDDKEIGVIDADNEEEALEKMQQVFPEYNYSMYDGCFYVEPC